MFEDEKFISEAIFSPGLQGKRVQESEAQHLELDKSHELIIQNEVFKRGKFIGDGILRSWPLW